MSHNDTNRLRWGLLCALLVMCRVNAVNSLVFTSPSTGSKSIKTNSPTFSSHTRNKKKSAKSKSMTLTYLEINGWLVTMGGVTVLIDPLLEGPLDFGIPSLYKGTKRVLPNESGEELIKSLAPMIDCILITQGLDDHTHVRTLQKLRQVMSIGGGISDNNTNDDFPIPIIAPLSAKKPLTKTCGFSSSSIQYLKHKEETIVLPRTTVSGSQNKKTTTTTATKIRIRATQGALVGPPWQRRENGYVLRVEQPQQDDDNQPSLYIEPHVEFNRRELSELGPVDVVISPISGQTLPAFELVHGPKDTIRLIETLRPKFVVPMQNGDIDTEGPVSKLVSEVGSPSQFAQQLQTSTRSINTELVDVIPGKDIVISL